MGNFEGKMKWHKFLAFFLLWVSAISNFLSFSALRSGSIWGKYKDEVYDTFSGMKSADNVCAILSLIAAIVAVAAAIGLLKYRSFGPICVIALYVINAASSLYYSSALSSLLNHISSDVNVASIKSNYSATIITSIVMVGVNLIYFGKRKDLYN